MNLEEASSFNEVISGTLTFIATSKPSRQTLRYRKINPLPLFYKKPTC